jgi:hypothetical protein
MVSIKPLLVIPLAIVTLWLQGCGTYVPQINEVWEGVNITSDMELRIKQNIFCETVQAIRDVRRIITVPGYGPSIPDDYGVQMQIGLTVEEVGSINPGVTYTDPLKNALVHGANVAQQFSLSAGGTLSSTATRTDTSYSYYNVGRIVGRGANIEVCQNLNRAGSSPFLRSELGIEDFLLQVVPGAIAFHSSAPAKGGAGKNAKLDVFSYEIKFVIVSNGNITPTWKLVNVTANSGNLPFLNLGRTRTHDLILTIGPGVDRPADFALQTHFTGQIVQSNQLRQSIVAAPQSFIFTPQF